MPQKDGTGPMNNDQHEQTKQRPANEPPGPGGMRPGRGLGRGGGKGRRDGTGGGMGRGGGGRGGRRGQLG